MSVRGTEGAERSREVSPLRTVDAAPGHVSACWEMDRVSHGAPHRMEVSPA